MQNDTQKIVKELEHLNVNIRALTQVIKDRKENDNDKQGFYYTERWEPGAEGTPGYEYERGTIHSGQ